MFLTKLVQCLHYRAVQLSRLAFRAAILRARHAILGAYFHIIIVRAPDLFERLCIGKIEAVAQINHGARHNGVPDLTAVPPTFLLPPSFGANTTVFPKVNAMPKPVPSVFTGSKVILACKDFSRDARVAPMIADDQ